MPFYFILLFFITIFCMPFENNYSPLRYLLLLAPSHGKSPYLLLDRQQIPDLQGNKLAIKAIPKLVDGICASPFTEDSMVAQKGDTA